MKLEKKLSFQGSKRNDPGTTNNENSKVILSQKEQMSALLAPFEEKSPLTRGFPS